MVDSWQWLQESEDWPKSYKLYTGQLTFQIAGHSEEQALRRLKQLEEFLQNLVSDEDGNGPHDSVRYTPPFGAFDTDESRYNIQFQEEHTYQSAEELRPSMGSDEILEWSWLRPDEGTADYDAAALAHQVLIGDANEDEE